MALYELEKDEIRSLIRFNKEKEDNLIRQQSQVKCLGCILDPDIYEMQLNRIKASLDELSEKDAYWEYVLENDETDSQE